MSLAACLLTLLLPARAQDSLTVAGDQPGQEAAVGLIDAVWDDLPEDGVVIYLTCPRKDCVGQSPSWFTTAAWEAGLSEVGVYDPAPDLGLSADRLDTLRDTYHASPTALAARLAEELTRSDVPVRAVLLVYPRQDGNKLLLSYQLHYAFSAQRDLIGRLTVKLPPPPPVLPPPAPPYRSHPTVWVGAGVMAAGAATIAASSIYSLRAEDPNISALSATTAVGWLGVMGGGAMMLIPAVHNDTVLPTVRIRF